MTQEINPLTMIWIVLTAAVPVVLALCGLLLLALMISVWRFHEQRQVRHSPLTRNLLRPPGHSLRRRIDELTYDIDAYLVALVGLPALLFCVHISQSYFGNQPESLLRIATSLILGVLMMSVAGWKLLSLLRQRKLMTLGLEGELATGEELNQLMLLGCRVFHDVPARWGNLDHVVISHSGVYLVNTKMIGKPKDGDGNADVVVDHSTNTVRFPDRTWRIPVDQLETERKWLTQHLTSAVGRQVEVEPMVALPGWFIKERIGRGPVYVFNPFKPSKFFVQKRSVLSDEMVDRIAHQLEQLCRDVEPSYRAKSNWGDKR